MARKETKSIKIDAKTWEQLDYLCKALNQQKTAFLKELLDMVFSHGRQFETLNLTYFSYGDVLRIDFEGRSRILSGSFQLPMNASSEEIDKRVDEEAQKGFESLEKRRQRDKTEKEA